LHQIIGNLNYPRLKSALDVVAWLKLLNPLIEGFALSRSLEWRSLQRHRLPFFPDSIDHGWNCLTQRGSRGLSFLSIFRKQVIEQDDVSGDLIDFTLTCVIGTLRARDQKPKHKSGQCRYHPHAQLYDFLGVGAEMAFWQYSLDDAVALMEPRSRSP